MQFNMQGYHDMSQLQYEHSKGNFEQQHNNFQEHGSNLQPEDSRNEEVEEIPESAVRQGKGKHGGKSKRGKAFSREEDLLVCSAWLNVSKDAVIGMVQMCIVIML